MPRASGAQLPETIMGDRAQVIIQRNATNIHFYTHWRGYELPLILSDALKRGKSRWNDESYLARVIFCEMVGSDDSVLGFGISTAYQDSVPERDLYVDVDNMTVRYMDREWTFDQYVKIHLPRWDTLTEEPE
jgi:hypothetical protein